MIRLGCILLLAFSVQGAEFFTGQAARAVLSQPSFSAHEGTGIAASAMTIVEQRLYVADTSKRVLTFDLSKIPGPKIDLGSRGSDGCPLCGFSPVASISQAVAPGSSTVSLYGKKLAAIDTQTHRILIWRDISAPTPSGKPDVILNLTDPGYPLPSESTLIDPISVAIDRTHLFVGDAALHRVLVWRSLPTSSNQPADAVLGQPDFGSKEMSDSPRADSIARPDALVSDGYSLFVGDSHDRRILVFTPADTPLPNEALLNSASLAPGPLAPGALLTVKGSGLAARSFSAPDEGSAALPTKLGGVEVLLNGVALSILSVSPSEVRTQLPYSSPAASSASLYIRQEREDGSIAVTSPGTVSISAASPGIFGFSGTEPRPGMLLHSGDQPLFDSETPLSAEAPAKPGEVITAWVTGLHPIASSSDQMPMAGVPFSGSDLVFTPVRANVNGQSAEVISTSLPQTAVGVYQVRVLLPSFLAPGRAQLVISEDGFTSNAVTLPVQIPTP